MIKFSLQAFFLKLYKELEVEEQDDITTTIQRKSFLYIIQDSHEYFCHILRGISLREIKTGVTRNI